MLVRHCPSWHAEALARQKSICFLTFQSKNERMHLVIILNNWNLEWVFNMSSALWGGGTPKRVLEEEEEAPTSTSPPNHPSQRREEERRGGDWSFPPPAYAREAERCGGGWSFPPHSTREEEQFRSREKQPSHSSLGPTSSRALVLANHRWPNIEKTATYTR
jgi:hypothetical protein